MEFVAQVQSAHFWTGLLTVVWVNIILSGDNAVVIALATRSVPVRQQKQAIAWGAGASVLMRIMLTVVAAELLTWPYLRIIGGLLLFWIAISLLLPDDGAGGIESPTNLLQAIKTILVADLAMSLDNVIAVAAAAKGSFVVLALGLAISIPLVIFGATVLMKLMQRLPLIVTFGAGILGWVAGEMLVTDPVLLEWIAMRAGWMRLPTPLGDVSWAQIFGALLVVVAGHWLARRRV